MTERIKITKELLVEVAKFLFTSDSITRARSYYLVNVVEQILDDQEIVERLKEYGRKDNELFISTDPIQQLVDNFISDFVQSILGEQK